MLIIFMINQIFRESPFQGIVIPCPHKSVQTAKQLYGNEYEMNNVNKFYSTLMFNVYSLGFW